MANENNRVCRFAIPATLVQETPALVAASMFGMCIINAHYEPAQNAFLYLAWHPKFPMTAYQILGADGKPPEVPWAVLIISDPDAQTGKVTLAWQLHRDRAKPDKGLLWSSTVDCDSQTLMSMPGMQGAAGHG